MNRRRRGLVLVGCLLLGGCSLSHPHYLAPDVRVGEPAFARTLEAHTLSRSIGGNRARVLLNGDQIFPAALEAIRSARKTKTMTVDGIWATVGSTNLDTRSFALNDEVNAVVYHNEVVGQLEKIFAEDLTYSRKVDFEQWRKPGSFPVRGEL